MTADKGGLIKVGDGTKCLAVYGKNINAANEVTIFAETCTGEKHQMWKHEKGALKNVNNPGKCLDIFENKCKNGQNLILWPCNGQNNQQFYFIGKNLKSTKCSKCLDMDMASSINNVLVWSCGVGKQNQKMDWADEFSLLEEDSAVEVETQVDDAINSVMEFTVENELEVAGGCNAEEQAAAMAKGASFAKIMDTCGRKSYNFWKNSFNADTFAACLKTQKLPVSAGCAKCFAIGPSYGAQNCKGACMSNSCSAGCKKCTAPVGPKLATCAGFSPPEQKC